MTRDDLLRTADELVRRYVDTFNERDLDAWVALFAEDAAVHDPFFPEPAKGREAIKNVVESVLRAFPDMQWRQLRPAIGVGDRVAVEVAANGVNDGPLAMPDGEVPATGRPVFFETATFWLIGPDGLITEERSYFDATGIAVQLGMTS